MMSFRIDDDTKDTIELLKKELRISKSSIIRMAIKHFYNYVRKINK